MNEVNLRTARPPRSLQRNDSACAMAHKPLLLTLSAQSSTLFSGNLNLFCTTEVSSLILLPFSPNHTKIKQIQKDLFLVKNKKQIQQVCKCKNVESLFCITIRGFAFTFYKGAATPLFPFIFVHTALYANIKLCRA